MKKFLFLLMIIGADSYAMLRVTKALIKPRYFSTSLWGRWPNYSTEQAFLITQVTLHNNHLTYQDAYDRALKEKIERSASQVCPTHNPPKCVTCWRAQYLAFTRVSEELYKRGT